jgi:hypothetical protein
MKIKIEFQHQELNVILQVLAEAPYKIAAPIITSIQRQVSPPSEKTAPASRENRAAPAKEKQAAPAAEENAEQS